MAHLKVSRLAYFKRTLNCSSPVGKLASRHLWTHVNSKAIFTVNTRTYITPEQSSISNYSTSAKNSSAGEQHRGKARQGQIPGSFAADDSGNKFLRLVGLGGVVTVVGGYFIYHSNERKPPIEARKPNLPRTLSDDQRTTMGGPFTLINHEGKVVTVKDFIGHWTLIYFGYTSCPEDCPEELQKLAEAVETTEKHTGERVSPIFVTLDPKRDSPEQLKAYLSEFHPRFVGLTGNADSIRQVARQYRVFYKKVEDEGYDYLVEHSGLVYLMNPNMEFVKAFGREYDAKTLAAEVFEEMQKYKNRPMK